MAPVVRGYHVIFTKKVTTELDVRIEADSAGQAIIRAARNVDPGWEFSRVEVTADDGGVDEVVV